jgi:translation initiation factor IF-3
MIRIRQVRLIDDANNQVGIVDTDVARQMAYEKGLDLVEVSPDARPPVCKIMDYGKFRYALKKKEHESKKKQHKVQTKEIRLRPKIGDHDVGYKAKQARDFLLDGDKVQVTMLFRGREMAHMDVAKEVLDSFVKKLADVSKVERGAKMEGRRLSLLLLSTAPPRPKKPEHEKYEKHDDDKHDDKHEEKHDKEAKPEKQGSQEKSPSEDGHQPPSADGAAPAAPTA